MANWREKIELNKVIGELSEEFDLSRYEEDCPQEVKDRICAEINKSTVLSLHSDRIQKSKSVAELNRNLDKLFDIADKHKVWCGL